MKVLSLFDGISCGRIALEREGIKIERYVAFKNDKYAIRVSQRYKGIGNGWTVDVIAHIFKYINI